MERRVRRKSHARCEAGENSEITSKNYLSLLADRTNRTLRRLNELYAQHDQAGFIGTQRVDGKLILPEAMKVLAMGAAS